MVNIYAAIGCGNRSNRDRSKSFFRLPSVILHQGQRTYELSKRRQEVWLSRLNRSDIKPESYAHTRVCSDHFVTGMPSKLYDSTHPDWAPSQLLVFLHRSLSPTPLSPIQTWSSCSNPSFCNFVSPLLSMGWDSATNKDQCVCALWLAINRCRLSSNLAIVRMDPLPWVFWASFLLLPGLEWSRNSLAIVIALSRIIKLQNAVDHAYRIALLRAYVHSYSSRIAHTCTPRWRPLVWRIFKLRNCKGSIQLNSLICMAFEA